MRPSTPAGESYSARVACRTLLAARLQEPRYATILARSRLTLSELQGIVEAGRRAEHWERKRRSTSPVPGLELAPPGEPAEQAAALSQASAAPSVDAQRKAAEAIALQAQRWNICRPKLRDVVKRSEELLELWSRC